MAAVLKPGWSKPSTILFASEIPVNEKAFSFALAQAREFSSNLILFHAYDTLVVAASEASGIRYYDYAAAARSEKQHLEPFAQRIREAGLSCEVVVGTASGAQAGQVYGMEAQRRYDIAYKQCMYAKGNQVPGASTRRVRRALATSSSVRHEHRPAGLQPFLSAAAGSIALFPRHSHLSR